MLTVHPWPNQHWGPVCAQRESNKKLTLADSQEWSFAFADQLVK